MAATVPSAITSPGPTSGRNRSSAARLVLLALLASVAPSPLAPGQGQPGERPDKKRAEPVEAFFNQGPIPHLRIDAAPAELEKLKAQPRTYVRAAVREVTPGQAERAYPDVAIHLKGRAGSFRGFGDKPGLTIEFDKFSKGQRFYGLEKIHLNNSVQDPTYLHEQLGGQIFRAAGIPAARVTHARVWLNGADAGFYVLKEGHDDVFLKRFFPDPSGILYEGGFVSDIDQPLVERANKSRKDPARLKELLEATRERDPATRRQRLDKVLDIDPFLTMMAVEAMIAHWDGYAGNRNNYRVYHDPKSDKFVFIPHGMDQLFGSLDYPLMPRNGLLARILTESAADQGAYVERVAHLRQTLFQPEALAERVSKASERILPTLQQMNPEIARQHKEQAADLRNRIVERIRHIDRQLASQPRPLKFDAAGIASLAGWEQCQAGGQTAFDPVQENGKSHLRIRANSAEAVASLRITVLLPRGRYVLEGRCRAVHVSAGNGPNTGVGLRISGGQRNAGLVGDSGWQKVEYEIEVGEDSRPVVLVCEFSGNSGEAWFDPDSLKLRRR
jgi:hypothetical protein